MKHIYLIGDSIRFGALTASFDSSLYADWVHLNTEGCRILADRVIEVCLNEA